MRYRCSCELPIQTPGVNSPDTCVKCSGLIDPDWTSNNQTVGEFYDRLEEALFPPKAGPDRAFRDFRLQAEMRELAGRSRFGHRHLARDNSREAQEEAADLANYAMFEILRERRNGEQEEWALALTAARHAYLAHQYATALRKHEHKSISEFEGPR